ncbi:uncharacterized protein TrAtP1_000597 [Trichoderma atroviride]|uniref:uncharacterized protein n=1 Tax=Hypocrea atroviridis TaxID=63577 RepID=UPI00332D6A89|nr:hypothetical protein TrAtP1_000597 [Trichoderma atroviride]
MLPLLLCCSTNASGSDMHEIIGLQVNWPQSHPAGSHSGSNDCIDLVIWSIAPPQKGTGSPITRTASSKRKRLSVPTNQKFFIKSVSSCCRLSKALSCFVTRWSQSPAPSFAAAQFPAPTTGPYSGGPRSTLHALHTGTCLACSQVPVCRTVLGHVHVPGVYLYRYLPAQTRVTDTAPACRWIPRCVPLQARSSAPCAP